MFCKGKVTNSLLPRPDRSLATEGCKNLPGLTIKQMLVDKPVVTYMAKLSEDPGDFLQ